jgi:hypothetical protein
VQRYSGENGGQNGGSGALLRCCAAEFNEHRKTQRVRAARIHCTGQIAAFRGPRATQTLRSSYLSWTATMFEISRGDPNNTCKPKILLCSTYYTFSSFLL